ncbi:MAG TPA: 2-C-methyl-D-erythritol 4-phosphate cytidylyltransferase [Vicinamibacterales bacterium]|nr:2-C-methyl-D-erythritol 4-phosphate cytidylyltransferase [Vicinamibacterales bacterium]
MRVAAIIVAGGKGERAGAALPKQFLDLGDGRTMLEVTVQAFLSCPQIDEVVVAVPPGFASRVAASARLQVVDGGARRQDSMANAFARVSDQVDVVLVHDAARPFVSEQLITQTIAAAYQHGAAIVALPVRDTVKRTVVSGSTRAIRETLAREDIVLAQTPQGFRRDILSDAMAAARHLDVTDEAMLVERAGIPVHIVEGDPENVKITTPEDLARARRRSDPGRVAQSRIGTGYDLHRLVTDRPLILGGVRIPFEMGLQGHSDADIVCHAVTDAILGAAALGDIGLMFPDSDPKWKDADSLEMLRAAAAAIHQAGFAVGNIDVTVIAERPKLRPYIHDMRANLAAALRVEVAAVSVKGKTNETVDATGRGEAMACHAVALLRGDTA